MCFDVNNVILVFTDENVFQDIKYIDSTDMNLIGIPLRIKEAIIKEETSRH